MQRESFIVKENLVMAKKGKDADGGASRKRKASDLQSDCMLYMALLILF